MADLFRDGLLRGEAREGNRQPGAANGDEGVRSMRLPGEKKSEAESGVTGGYDAVHEARIFHVGETYSLGNQASKYLTECLSRRSISA